jgi:predicted dehydrogenase
LAAVHDDATPAEYLERWQLHNEMFGDDACLEGWISEEHGVRLVISQSVLVGDVPSKEHADTLLMRLGLKPTPDGYWLRADGTVVIADTKPANFIQSSSGDIRPIDLVVRRPSDLMLKHWSLTSSQVESALPVANISIIGAGNFARTMLLPHVRGQLTLHTVVNATALSAAHVKEKFGFLHAETDPSKAWAAGGAVIISTRHHLHAAQVLAGLQQDRHVFVEKPLCLTVAELEEMHGTESSGSVMVGFNRRFAPAMVALKQRIDATMSAVSLSITVNAGAVAPDHWYAQVDQSGGRIIGEACHFYDLACYLLGEPVRVFAQSVGRGAASDSVAAQIEFRSGATAQVLYSAEGDASYAKESYRVMGSGWVAESENALSLTVHEQRKSRRQTFSSKGHAEEMAAWLAYLKGQQPHPMSWESIYQSMGLTFAVVRAVQDSKAVELPLVR